MSSAPHIRFALPADRSASEPPEARGLARDEVRLLVADGSRITHASFRDIGRFLAPGDLLVVNASGTLAAAVAGVRRDARSDRAPVVVHFSTPLRASGSSCRAAPGCCSSARTGGTRAEARAKSTLGRVLTAGAAVMALLPIATEHAPDATRPRTGSGGQQ